MFNEIYVSIDSRLLYLFDVFTGWSCTLVSLTVGFSFCLDLGDMLLSLLPVLVLDRALGFSFSLFVLDVLG